LLAILAEVNSSKIGLMKGRGDRRNAGLPRRALNFSLMGAVLGFSG